jgi:hypothetical protein
MTMSRRGSSTTNERTITTREVIAHDAGRNGQVGERERDAPGVDRHR